MKEPETSAEKALQSEVQRLGSGFEGEVGIAVRDIETGFIAHHNGRDFFPQQSVSKLWVALTALRKADRGNFDLAHQVTLRKEDLTLFHQPIRPLVLNGDGYTTTREDLLVRALQRSDNTANDVLLWQIGGPEAVRKALKAANLDSIRFGPGERLLQSSIAGMDWRPRYSLGYAFFEARDEVPTEARRRAFEEYLKNPVDGATPVGLVIALGRLAEGELLSQASTERLLGILKETRSGPRRLKGGLPPGWSIAHKTGTGPEFQEAQAGYNDVGIITSDTGRTYAVAVLIGRTSQPPILRMTLMQNVVAALVQYDAAREE